MFRRVTEKIDWVFFFSFPAKIEKCRSMIILTRVSQKLGFIGFTDAHVL
jgi:hypothetical protein